MVVLFVATTGICALGWLNSRMLNRAVLYYYMEIKHQDEPDIEELKKCLMEAWKRLFKADQTQP